MSEQRERLKEIYDSQMEALVTTKVSKRSYASGKTAWQIRWRVPGEVKVQSFTHPDRSLVANMKAQIESRGHRLRGDDPRILDLSLVTGERSEPSSVVPTFDAACRSYIATRGKANARTKHRYLRYLELHLQALARKPLDRITSDMITELVLACRAKGLAETTINGVHGLVAGVFKREVARGSIARNPALEGRQERAIHRTRVWRDKFLTHTEYDILARKLDPFIYEFCEVLIGTGMRWGEVAALRVEDLRLDKDPAIFVTRTLHFDQRGTVEVHGCKAGSERTLVIDHDLAAMLRKRTFGKPGHALVFPSKRGLPMRYSTWYGYWTRSVKAARAAGLGKPVTPHVLRHTHGAWLLDATGNLLEVSRRLGHASIKMTADVYGHRLPDGDDRTRSVLATMRADSAAASRGATRKGLRAVN
jgi:integrase